MPRPSVRRRGPSPRRDAFLAVVVLAAVTTWLAVRGTTGWKLLLPAVATVVVPCLILFGGERAARAVDRFARAVGTALTSTLFGLLAVVMVVIPHAVSRAFSIDQLAAPGRWSRPARRRSPSHSQWADDRAPGRLTLRRTARSLAVPMVMVLGAGWLLTGQGGSGERGFVLGLPSSGAVTDDAVPPPLLFPAPEGVQDAPLAEGEIPAAVQDDPWWATDAFQDAQGFAIAPKGAWRFENPYRMLDLRSPYVNVTDGRRHTWQPPPCECPRLTVWMYGGSTLWGIGQRDDHTIPSELARVAQENGMVLDVENRGLPGAHHWLESERFAWDLTVDPAPDLVVFYDGVNDRWWDMGLHDRIFEHLWDESGRSDEGPPALRDSRVLPPPPPTAAGLQLTAEGVRRYDTARGMSKATSESSGVPVRYVWQPDRFTRPFEPTEPHFDTDHENSARLGSQYAAENLAPDVIDLTRALEDARGPIYTDDVHHDERGARLVAEALFAVLEPDLQDLAG